MGMPGFGEWIIIAGVFVLLFGAKKLPGLGTAIGESIRNFKKGIGGADDDKKLEDGSKKDSENNKS